MCSVWSQTRSVNTVARRSVIGLCPAEEHEEVSSNITLLLCTHKRTSHKAGPTEERGAHQKGMFTFSRVSIC